MPTKQTQLETKENKTNNAKDRIQDIWDTTLEVQRKALLAQKELLAKLPPIIPVIPGLWKEQISHFSALFKLLSGKDVEGTQFSSREEQLKAVASEEINAFFGKGEAALDAIILLATFGEGSIIAGVAKGETKEVAAKVLEFLTKAGLKGQEGKIIDMIPIFLRGVSKTIENDKITQFIGKSADVFGKLADNPLTRKAMVNGLQQSSIWHSIQEGLNNSQKRAEMIGSICDRGKPIIEAIFTTRK